MTRIPLLCLVLACCALLGCDSQEKAAIGSKENPIRMHFVPSKESTKIIESAKPIADAIKARTGFYVASRVPSDYAAVLTALQTDGVDLAWLAPFAYVLAHDRSGAEVALRTLRHGESHYYGQVLVRADSGIKSLSDLNGKRVAFTDSVSAGGYIYPSALFEKEGVKPKSTIHAGSHTSAVIAVYQGSVDAACCFWSPPRENGEIADARILVLDKWPDAKDVLVTLAKTEPIPNDTVTFRKGVPADVREKIVAALLDFAGTDEGKKALNDLYQITGLERADDAFYDPVREVLGRVGKDASQLLKRE